MSDDAPPSFAARAEAIAEAAAAWRDPEHEARAEAVKKTLGAPNRFTEEALAFALNQPLHLLTPEAIRAWTAGREAAAPLTVGVLNAGNVPLAGLQDFLAVLLTGHRYLGSVSSKSPHLLPAFAEEIKRRAPGLPAAFAEAEEVFAQADAIIATGTDETRAWASSECAAHGIPESRRLLRGHRFGVAVLDGEESADEREALAEDVLLHEGYGCRNAALVWAPKNLSPDPYLDALAAFRGVFPVHPEVPGTLQMQQAFLEATDQPHAYGEGLEFLVSRGAPEVQRPGHLRWAEYAHLREAAGWLRENAQKLQLVLARDAVAERLSELAKGLPLAPFGTAQRPPLDWRPDGTDTIGFLAGLRV